MTRRPVRVLHTSDVHLGTDSPGCQGRTHRRDCLCPINVIEQVVRERRVDVVLIAGDLFDHAKVSDDLVTATFARLAALDADVVLLPGNHDAHESGDTAVYRRHRSMIDEARVRFFDAVAGDTHDAADAGLRIWSRSMDDHTPDFVPLAGPPPHPEDRWFIVAGHGHFAPDGTESHRSSRITVEHIDSTRADYVALGHWHVTTDLATRGTSTPAWYCGAPLFGYGAGNVLLVDFVPDKPVQVRPIDILNHPAASCSG
jgi:DNA repair protein SbcD/Mre11